MMYQLTIATVFVILQTTWLCDAKPSGQSVEMPANCKGKDYCSTKHTDYPQEIIDRLLKNVSNLFVDKVRDHDSSNKVSHYTPNDCETRISFRPIYEIIDKDGNLRFVAQTENNFRQIVRTEECVNPGRLLHDTFNFHQIQLQNTKLFCVQDYLEYKFFVLSLDKKSMETAWLRKGVPVSCSCRREE